MIEVNWRINYIPATLCAFKALLDTILIAPRR